MSQLKISLTHGSPEKLSPDVLVYAVTDDAMKKGKLRDAGLIGLDELLGGVLSRALADAEFDGKSGAEVVLHTHGKLASDRLVVLGVGAEDKLDREAARLAASRAVKIGEKLKAKKAALRFPNLGNADTLSAAAEGALLGAYRFDKYRSDRKPARLTELQLVIDGAARKEQKAALQEGILLGEATNFARDLVNEPSNVITPTALSNAAKEMAKEAGLKFEVLERRDLEKLGMGMFVGVAQGSQEPPKLIHVWWEPPAAGRGKGRKASAPAPVCFVGKAVTFDSGGLSLKPPNAMETMKSDMAGSAAVFGAMRAIAALQPPFAVHAYVGATENMPSGTAQRPGDIVRARNGKTVEVLNTDAEGRLVLGDVLTLAADQKPAVLIDLATLTGAIVVALGPYMTGLFSNSDALAQELLDSAGHAGEEFWRMPLPDNLKELLKSPVADMKNIGGPKGGSITAALFLREFVDGAEAWAHLDVASSAFLDKEHGYHPRGGTGAGVRTLVELVRRRMA